LDIHFNCKKSNLIGFGHDYKDNIDTIKLNGCDVIWQRVVVDRNRLPQYVVDAPSTNAFTNRLDKYWRDDMGI